MQKKLWHPTADIIAALKPIIIRRFMENQVIAAFFRRHGAESQMSEIYDSLSYFGTLTRFLRSGWSDVYQAWWNYNLTRKSRILRSSKFDYFSYCVEEIEALVREEKAIVLNQILGAHPSLGTNRHFHQLMANIFTTGPDPTPMVSRPVSDTCPTVKRDYLKLNVDQIPGYLLDAEAFYLYQLVRQNPSVAPICEIGSLAGKSTIALAWGVKHSPVKRPVYAIDRWDDPVTYALFIENIRQHGLENIIVPMQSSSARAARKLETGTLGLLFIDADHHYENVIGDYRRFQNRLDENSQVIFHDHYDCFPGVLKAVAEVAPAYYRSEDFLTLKRLTGFQIDNP